MKKIVIAIIFIALVFVSGCGVADYFGFDLSNFTLEPKEGENVSEEVNHPPVIEDIKLKKWHL